MENLVRILLQRHADALPPLDGYPLTARRFAAGELLSSAGDPLTRLCFITEGAAAVYRPLENGRVALLREYGGANTVGELELLMGYPTLTSDVRTLTHGSMLVIPLDEARGRIFDDPAMLRYLGREVAKKLEHTSRLAAQDHSYPLANRLAAFLLHARQGNRLTLRWSQVCDLMGVSYRHLLRTLSDFCDAGWLARDPDGYRILDVRALQALGGSIRYD